MVAAAGILASLAGVAAIAVPAVASVTTAISIGCLPVVVGITMAVHAMWHRPVLRGQEALLSLVAGLYLLALPLHGTVTLTFVLAAWFLASGVLRTAIAVRWRGAPGVGFQVTGGVLSAVLGVLIAASLPSSAAWALGPLVGVDLIFRGARAGRSTTADGTGDRAAMGADLSTLRCLLLGHGFGSRAARYKHYEIERAAAHVHAMLDTLMKVMSEPSGQRG
jgi:uncharacterized membrane protein HdeD (DUF308 family)